ncbi:MAG TPA: efflux RND transporter periplasmic adaptor subunit, partial [Candidatus Wallbacteria bacterium]|nr:efflux RND transporter periplasmic adaptor subunit [Candidatus Wallbacteria bacterium]
IVVKQAKAAVDASAARLRQLEIGSRPEEKKQAAEQLRQAEATSKTAISDYVRMKELFASNMISKQTMEATEAKATVSEAQYASVKLQKAIIDQGPRVEEKENMRALIRQQEASLELAMIQLEYATLKAPFDGIVSARHSNEGAFVNPSSPIYTLQQIDPIYASVDCPEKYMSLLQKGVRATIIIDALPGKKFSGVLERMPAVIDTVTRTARAEFTIENPDKLLRPGMFVRASISFEAKIGGANERF